MPEKDVTGRDEDAFDELFFKAMTFEEMSA
jgi:hypothetical protein